MTILSEENLQSKFSFLPALPTELSPHISMNCGHNRTRTGTTHRDRVALLPFNHTPIIGGDDRTRTYNLSINSALLFAIELHPHIFAGVERFELSTCRFGGCCFQPIKLHSHLVEPSGLEPELSCVSDRRVKPVTPGLYVWSHRDSNPNLMIKSHLD